MLRACLLTHLGQPEREKRQIEDGASATTRMDEDGWPTDFTLTLNASDGADDTLTWSVWHQACNGLRLI